MSTTKELTFFPSWTAGRKGYAERMRQVFQDYLRGKDLYLTPQRSKILDHLLEADQHLTQDDMYRALKAEGIGKVTIFRTLKMLEDCRIVERVTSPSGRPRFEVKAERPHHDHLICLGCGAITEVQWPEVEKIQDKTCKELGFEAVYHRHELFGRCSKCRTKPH